MARAGLIVSLVIVIGCNHDDGWTPEKRAEYQRQMDEAAQRQRAEQDATNHAAAEAATRERARIDGMTAAQLLAEIKTKGADCSTADCYASSAIAIANLIPVLRKKGATDRQIEKATAYYHRVRDAGEKLQGAADQVALYQARVKQCCDVPKFVHPVSEKKLCITWGFKKCVADSEDEVQQILRTF